MEVIYTRPEHGKIPAMASITKALALKVQEALDNGNVELSEAMRKRYQFLAYTDVEVETVHRFKDGRLRICLVARKRGWARYDLIIEPASLLEIVEYYDIPYLTMETLSDVEAYFNSKDDKDSTLIYQAWNNEMGVVLTIKEEVKSVMSLLGYVLYKSLVYAAAEYNPETMTSGVVEITDETTSDTQIPVYLISDYNNSHESPDGITVTRTPMVGGKFVITAESVNTQSGYVWDFKPSMPQFDIGEITYEDNKMHIECSLSKSVMTHGKRSVVGEVTLNGLVEEFDLSFEAKPDGGGDRIYGLTTNVDGEMLIYTYGTSVPTEDVVLGEVAYVRDPARPSNWDLSFGPVVRRTLNVTHGYIDGQTFPDAYDSDILMFVGTSEPDSGWWLTGEVRVRKSGPIPSFYLKVNGYTQQADKSEYIWDVGLYTDPEMTIPADLIPAFTTVSLGYSSNGSSSGTQVRYRKDGKYTVKVDPRYVIQGENMVFNGSIDVSEYQTTARHPMAQAIGWKEGAGVFFKPDRFEGPLFVFRMFEVDEAGVYQPRKTPIIISQTTEPFRYSSIRRQDLYSEVRYVMDATKWGEPFDAQFKLLVGYDGGRLNFDETITYTPVQYKFKEFREDPQKRYILSVFEVPEESGYGAIDIRPSVYYVEAAVPGDPNNPGSSGWSSMSVSPDKTEFYMTHQAWSIKDEGFDVTYYFSKWGDPISDVPYSTRVPGWSKEEEK